VAEKGCKWPYLAFIICYMIDIEYDTLNGKLGSQIAKSMINNLPILSSLLKVVFLFCPG